MIVSVGLRRRLPRSLVLENPTQPATRPHIIIRPRSRCPARRSPCTSAAGGRLLLAAPVNYGSSHRAAASGSNTATTRSSSSNNNNNINQSYYAVAAAAFVVGGALGARLVYSRLLPSSDGRSKSNPRKDTSRATVLLRNAPPPITKETALLSQQRNIDNPTLQMVDAQEFADFVARQREILNRVRTERYQPQAAERLHNELTTALMEDADQRIDDFVHWYLSYPTTYRLLGIAAQSAARHAVTWNKQDTLAEHVSRDLEEHVSAKYEALVLRPALTDPKLHVVFVRVLNDAHRDYVAAVQQLDASVAQFVADHAEPYYAAAPAPSDVVLDLDWAAQLQKVRHVPIAYEKSPERTVALVTAGAAAGKVAAGGTAVTAAKALVGKLTAPLVGKAAAATLSGKAATGVAGTAAALGGPVGAVAGAALGVGVDITVNAATGLFQKVALEEDVRESLQATITEWEELVLRPELERVQSVWYDHAELLLDVGSKCSGVEEDDHGGASPKNR